MRTIIASAALAALLATAPALAAELEVPEGGYVVSDDLSLLPEPVRAKREALLAAARSGEMDELKTIMDAEPAPPNVSFGDPEDPIAYLEQQSADGEGRETLAILADLLEAPYAAMDSGDGEAIYVWPYLAGMDDLSKLTAADEVVAIQLVGVDGLKDVKALGSWYNWRAFIGADGQWQAFVAGD